MGSHVLDYQMFVASKNRRLENAKVSSSKFDDGNWVFKLLFAKNFWVALCEFSVFSSRAIFFHILCVACCAATKH